MGHSLELGAVSASRAVRCAFVGDEPLLEQCVDMARTAGLDVVLVATKNEMVRDDAIEHGIPVVESDPAGLRHGLDEHPADVLFSVAYLRMVPDDVLARVMVAINFHDGPLPGYAGLNVTTWALLAGEHEHAITWHLMTSDVDAGEVVATERFPIAEDETSFSLNARCYEAALTTFPAIAAAIAAGTLSTEPQEAGEHRVFRRYDRPARLFDPRQPASETARTVRALDLGHRLRNPVGVVRLVVGDEVVVVDAVTEAEPSSAAPGTVMASDGDGVRIATADRDILITAASTPEGVGLDLPDAFRRLGLGSGDVLAPPPAELMTAVGELETVLARDESFWLGRVAAVDPARPPMLGGTGRGSRFVDVPPQTTDAELVATVALWLRRTTAPETVAFSLTDGRVRQIGRRLAPLTVPPVAVLDVDLDTPFDALRAAAEAELEVVAHRHPLLRDAIGREPLTRGHPFAPPVVVQVGEEGDAADTPLGDAVLRIVREAGNRIRLDAALDTADPAALDRVADQLSTLLGAAQAAPSAPGGDLAIVSAAEQIVLDAFNATALDHDRDATVDALFRAQVAATPDAPALSSGATTLTYGELQAAVAALADRLADLGVTHRDRVGIAVHRGIDMLVGVLATLELGAAYVPLDPTYPIERLQFMVDDSGLAVLLAANSTAAELARPAIPVLDPAQVDGPAPAADRSSVHDPSDLAYVIYTSGSTGTPKGVMLEHRQVVNFFVAMDEKIDRDPPGVWLAVTSLSFDISVLELLWTLTRGFHVVLKPDRALPAADGGAELTAAPTRPVSLSLFYFAAGEETAADGYRLLLESARFADRNGFEAVWTPERHFHAFGGAYPNPSVAGAALAAITERVGIRAGSVVLPLHSPIRVAEEWAVVDNLSRGRVAISFAAGWQPNDFVLNPTAFANAKEDLPRNIELVQRLWRGETVPMPGHDGAMVDVHTLPRPVQAELPIWLTSAGSPATFERAGTLGVNVLTHLLGQSVEQLAENVERYRSAWREAGHPGEGRVTLMMHTYLDRDADVAREVAREPMKSYLRTAVGLLRDVASAFPTFAGRGKGTDDLFKNLTADEMDQLLEMAASRYLSSSGLFGTPADAAKVIDVVSAAGVDEVACLIDFGVATDDVLTSLDLLLEAKLDVEARRAAVVATPSAEDAVIDDSVAGLVARHGVTHLQCTPSLAAMLLADPDDRAAIGGVRHLMLGGEALPAAMATELRQLLPERFTNMYGPTETTIWSLTYELDGDVGATVPIGTPIANTTVVVLDPAGRRLPIGVFGELHIGGEGVARGYHARPELTAERFVDRPGIGRMYATGDVVRIHPAGYVEFAGRADNQVKIRGHRIELGEIETVLDRHPDVVQSVVVARGDATDPRLLAYVVLRRGADVSGDALRKHVGEILPDVMVPSAAIALDAFPLTPNGKIDRKALPSEGPAMSADAQVWTAPPADDVERLVAEIWSAELERPVGRDDNFFDIGGHSLLAVKVFRRLSDATSARLSLTDVFRFPTVRTFAAHLDALQSAGTDDASPAPAAVSAPTGTDRGAMRRRALARRGGDQGGDG